MHKVSWKKNYLRNYIPADAENLQFSPKIKSTPMRETDNQAASKKYNTWVILIATVGYTKGSLIRRIIVKNYSFPLNAMGQQIWPLLYVVSSVLLES